MKKLTFLLLILIYSCKGEPKQIANTQGIFDFPDVMALSDDSVPEYMDESKILCKGKGLRVAKCISSQLKTGKCLGILKEGNRVYVVEIDCDEVKESPVDTLIN